MSRVIHISQFDPRKSEGGVALFARDLKRAIPDLVYVYNPQANRPWNNVRSSNEYSLKNGGILAEDTVVADGYYGLGLAGKVERLITVSHSTFAGWLRDNLMLPYKGFDPAWLVKAATAQEQAYRESDELVAVSTSAQEELWEFYRLESKVIFNGIDVELYRPGQMRGEGIVEVAGRDFNKGADMVSEVAAKGGYKIEPLGFEGEKHERWARNFYVAFLPSRHEGGPYAQLEALASGLRIVGYPSGYLKHDIPNNLAFTTYDYYWRTFSNLIKEALESQPTFDGADYAGEVFGIDRFINEWRTYLGGDHETYQAAVNTASQ